MSVFSRTNSRIRKFCPSSSVTSRTISRIRKFFSAPMWSPENSEVGASVFLAHRSELRESHGFVPNHRNSYQIAVAGPFSYRIHHRKKSAGISEEEDWLQKLPDKKKPLYSHSLPCVEAWLTKLGFYQSRGDRAVWSVECPDWHAQLSLDATDLYIRYLKTGPGSLEKDVERRFSYALSREDIENAILGGP